MIDQVRALLDHLPSYEVRSIARLGEESDNVAYEVNGELILRGSTEDDPAHRSESTRREAACWPNCPRCRSRDRSSPIPRRPRVRQATRPSLMEHAVAEPTRLAAPLGGFLGHLHRAPLEKTEELVEREFYPPTAWRQDAEQGYREIAGAHGGSPLGRGLPRQKAAGGTPCGGLLPQGSQGRACVGGRRGERRHGHHRLDRRGYNRSRPRPRADYRALGPEVFDLAPAHYEVRFDAADRKRAVFYARCKLLEDIAYGIGAPGAGRYVEAGLAHFTRTFA